MLEMAKAVRRGAAALLDVDRVQFALDVAAPEFEEFAELGKLRGEVEFLPDERLQEGRVVRQAVEDFGGRQPVAPGLQLVNGHVVPRGRTIYLQATRCRRNRSAAIAKTTLKQCTSSHATRLLPDVCGPACGARRLE